MREWLKALPPEDRKIIGDDLKTAQTGCNSHDHDTRPAKIRARRTCHLLGRLDWRGCCLLALDVAAATGQDAQTLRAAWIAMELTGWYAIVPLALASLLTGLVMSLGTK